MKQYRFLLVSICLIVGSLSYSQEVYITKTGSKYHQENCHYLRYSKIKIDLSKATERGFTSCINFNQKKTRVKITSSSSDSYSSVKSVPAKKVTASQCTGKTKAGNRCKRKTKNANGRCYQH